MIETETASGFIRNPLAWAADCEAQAEAEIEPEARDAFKQLAAEFEHAASEIDGLVSTVEAMFNRKIIAR